MTITENIVKGRWGFYPCEYATYQKLRKLFGFYLKSKRMDATHTRWQRKEPQNRIQMERIIDGQGRFCGRKPIIVNGQPVAIPEPPLMKVSISNWVEDDYRNARYPKATAEEVKPLKLTLSAIEQQLRACES